MGELRLQKELAVLDIPSYAKCEFSEPTIMKFYLTVDFTKEKCLWTGKKYIFQIEVANEYPISPPECICQT